MCRNGEAHCWLAATQTTNSIMAQKIMTEDNSLVFECGNFFLFLHHHMTCTTQPIGFMPFQSAMAGACILFVFVLRGHGARALSTSQKGLKGDQTNTNEHLWVWDGSLSDSSSMLCHTKVEGTSRVKPKFERTRRV